MFSHGNLVRLAMGALCAVVVLATLGMNGRDSSPQESKPINVEPVTNPSNEPNVVPITTDPGWDGWKCKQVNTCPTALLIGWDKNYVGCYRILGLGCGGECTLCTGATIQYDACVPVEGEVCSPQQGGSNPNQILCGTKTRYPDCQYFGTAPANETATPNSCYCRGTPVVTGLPCYVSECDR